MPYRVSPFAELSGRLATLPQFLDAAEDLRTLFLLTPSSLTSQPRKLIALLEVAKHTLELAGVRLHVFSSCPTVLQSSKAAYFNLLLELRAQLPNIAITDRELQVRSSRLLFPLSTTLTIGRETEAALRSMGAYLKGDLNDSEVSSSSSGSSSITDNQDSARSIAPPRRRRGFSPLPPPPHSMPPPDLTGVSKFILSHGHVSSNLRTFHVADMDRSRSRSRGHNASSSRKRKREREDEDEDGDDGTENFAPIILRQSPIRRSFGIFCTGKGSGGAPGQSPGSRVISRY